MSATGKQIPVLTPAYGRKYHTSKECLDDYLSGKEFVFNLAGHNLDGTICNKWHTYYNVVKLQFGKETFIYIGN